MKKWLFQIAVNAITLLIIAHFSDSVYVAGIGTAILAGFILTIVNSIVKPILVLFTLPITVMSLGLFLFVINAVMLLITSTLLGANFVIDGFGTAIIVAIVFAILSSLIQSFIVDPITKR